MKQQELIKVVWAGKGSRTLKYHQLLEDRLGLAPDETAVLTVLLLRGAQTPGELRSRTERLHAFADRAAVEDCLARLAARSVPLVRQLERRPGQHDLRWAHLLGPLPATEAIPARPAAPVDREVVLAGGASARDAHVVAGYDAVAEAYADEFGAELSGKPFDRWLLQRVSELSDGPIADVGCGPGQSTRMLADAGAEVVGMDLSPAMVAVATTRHPDLTFQVGDLTRLLRPPTAAAWGAVVGWYAGVHLAGSELQPACSGLARVLAPGGWLALSLFAGAEVRHRAEWFGHPVALDFVLHDPGDVLAAVRGAGLEVEEWYLRGPLPRVETDAERLYVLARQPHSR